MEGTVHRQRWDNSGEKKTCEGCGRQTPRTWNHEGKTLCEICYRQAIRQRNLMNTLTSESKVKDHYRGSI